MPPKCELCQTYHSQRKPCPADPAQSAPSAERPIDLQKEARELMGLLKLDVTGGQILFSALSRLQKAAALRTAQLERELQEFRKLESLPFSRSKMIARAETAESALAAQRELIEKVLSDIQDIRLTTTGMERAFRLGQKYGVAHGIAVAIIDAESILQRALLTVAAQTPEEK